ncbi:MAG: hypothetical protein ACK4PI_03390 [Tepidisphaerales bacterium]
MSRAAPVVTALLRTLRLAREALRRRRPVGHRDLLRIYLRQIADLDPDRIAGPDDPGYQYLLAAVPKLTRLAPGTAAAWRDIRPDRRFDRAAFRRTTCGRGVVLNNDGRCNGRRPATPLRRPGVR